VLPEIVESHASIFGRVRRIDSGLENFDEQNRKMTSANVERVSFSILPRIVEMIQAFQPIK
jgi:hypothetical protein